MCVNLHAAVEVHSINTDCRVVFDTEIDVFANAEAEVTRFRKVLFLQFVFFDFQATLENFLCLWTANCYMYSNLFIAADTECADGVAGFAY